MTPLTEMQRLEVIGLAETLMVACAGMLSVDAGHITSEGRTYAARIMDDVREVLVKSSNVLRLASSMAPRTEQSIRELAACRVFRKPSMNRNELVRVAKLCGVDLTQKATA